MVGGHRISEEGKTSSPLDGGDLRDIPGHAGEERWILHIGAAFIPFVHVAGRGLDLLPFFAAGEYIGVLIRELIPSQTAGNGVGNLLFGRPDVAKKDIVAVLILPDFVLCGAPQPGLPKARAS